MPGFDPEKMLIPNDGHWNQPVMNSWRIKDLIEAISYSASHLHDNIRGKSYE
jgi:hypothetical protein